MNNQLKNLTSQIQKERLTTEEKTILRQNLLHFMSEHPASVKTSVGSFWFMRHRSFSFGLSLVLICVIAVSSASYAAEFSLPGEALYGLKVNITEPLRGAMQADVEDQARWDSALVERRLAEAQLLAEAGELQDGKEEEIVQRLTIQTTKARVSVQQVSIKDTLKAAELNARLEASLSTHHELLDNEDDQPKQLDSVSLKQSLELQASSTRALSNELETDWHNQNDRQKAQKALEQTTRKLQTRLDLDNKQLQQPTNQDSLSKDQRAKVEQKLSEAQQLIKPKNLPNSTSTNSQSLVDLQRALKLEREIQILSQPKKKNDRSILKSVYSKEQSNKKVSDKEKTQSIEQQSRD